MLGHLHSIRLRQTTNSPFTGRVVRQQRKRLEGHDRRGPDDLGWIVLLCVSLRDDLSRRGRVAIVHTEDIDPKHALEVLWCKFEERLHLCYACIGDPKDVSTACLPEKGKDEHRVQRTQLLYAGLYHLLDLLQVRHVSDGRARLSAHGLDLGDHFVNPCFVRFDVVDADVVAVVGKAKGNRFPSAMVSAAKSNGFSNSHSATGSSHDCRPVLIRW